LRDVDHARLLALARAAQVLLLVHLQDHNEVALVPQDVRPLAVAARQQLGRGAVD
jgi:hypothetical protein